MPTRVHIAPGCRARLPEVAASLGLEGVVLVVDPGLQATPWPEQVDRMLTTAGVRAEIFDRVEPNPRTTTAVGIAAKLRASGAGGVVALGGGSVLDAAKAAAMLATNPGSPESYEGPDRYPNPPLPMIAMPTTCGTGSEVTWVSVLSHQPSRRKISVKGESMFPAQALVDADLIATLPPDLIAWTGLDALTHALEATTCALANPVSDSLAEKAIVLLFEYLERAVADVEADAPARAAVMRAATTAGLAFGNADVAGVHCLSESLGGMFDLPHGLANAVLLGPVLRYHRPHVERRLAALEALVDPGGDPRIPAAWRAGSFLDRIDGLVDRLGVPTFSSFAVAARDLGAVAKQAVDNGSNGSNPQPMAENDYLKILRALA